MIVAGERGSRPGRVPRLRRRARRSTPRATRSPPGHEDRTPPEAVPRSGERPTAGWRVRVVPNLYPALSAGRRRRRATTRSRGGRGEPDLFASRARARRHEVIVNAPRPGAARSPSSTPEQVETAMSRLARAHAHARRRGLRARDRQRGQGGGRVAAAHARAAVRPAVRAGGASRASASASPPTPTAPQGRNLLEDVLQEEVRRRERDRRDRRRGGGALPVRGARAVPLPDRAAPARARASRTTARSARACCTTSLTPARRARSASLPPLNMWVRTAPRDAEHFCWRIEVMPRLAQLAGLEIGTGVHLNVLAPEDAAAAAARAAETPCSFPAAHAARSAPGPDVRCRAAPGAAAVRPLGRGARRALRRRPPEDRAIGEITWFPDRTWGGRTYVPATAPADDGGEVFGYVVLHARARGRAGRWTSRPRPTSRTRPPPRTPTGRSTSPTTRSATGAAPRAAAG